LCDHHPLLAEEIELFCPSLKFKRQIAAQHTKKKELVVGNSKKEPAKAQNSRHQKLCNSFRTWRNSEV
jgi:hypothetical protein